MSLSKIATVLGVVGLSAALSGCVSHLPKVEQFPQTSQKKVLAAGQWQLMAHDIAANTSALMDRAGLGSSTTLYVWAPSNSSPFDCAFRDMLMTELVKNGKSLVTTPEMASAIVRYQVRVIRHRSDRRAHTSHNYPTHNEVVLTTMVTSGDHYLARETEVYYLEDEDAYLFTRSSMRPVFMEVN